MRIAGVADNHGSTLFHQLLGVTELQAMKWDALYWQKVLAHTALDGDELAVLGDNAKDDYEMPRSVGIAGTFLLTSGEDRSAESTDSLVYVRNFSQVADMLIRARAANQLVEHHVI
jgi:FMN phosphatase YigB (HAD superfamily)